MISHVSLKTMWMSLLPLKSEGRSKSRSKESYTGKGASETQEMGGDSGESSEQLERIRAIQTLKRGANSTGSTYDQKRWPEEERHTKAVVSEVVEKHAVVMDSDA